MWYDWFNLKRGIEPFWLELLPDMSAWEILIGKWPLIPNMLPEKRLEAPLTTATLTSVLAKKVVLQLDVSTFTSTVVTTNTSNIIQRDDRMRTFEDNLPKQKEDLILSLVCFFSGLLPGIVVKFDDVSRNVFFNFNYKWRIQNLLFYDNAALNVKKIIFHLSWLCTFWSKHRINVLVGKKIVSNECRSVRNTTGIH